LAAGASPVKQQQGHVGEAGETGKQLWPIESRPFGSSIGHFFLDIAERPEDVLAAERVSGVEQSAERLLNRRRRPVCFHFGITFGEDMEACSNRRKAGTERSSTIKLTVKLDVLYLGIDML